MINAIEQGIITTTAKQRMIELESTKEELELKIIKEEPKRPLLTEEGLIFRLQRFRGLDTTKKEHKQKLIDSFVNAVYVYDDKPVLTFNYNEANNTVTLDEVNGSIIECSGVPYRVFIRDLIYEYSIFFCFNLYVPSKVLYLALFCYADSGSLW